MKTVVTSPGGQHVAMGDGLPTVLIGERINPYGKGGIKEALKAKDMEPIRTEALHQVQAGADILNVSVGAFGVDETVMLPLVVRELASLVDIPLCLESRNPAALEAALQIECGTPVVNSVTGEEAVLENLLPIVQKYNTAVIALVTDRAGIPAEPEKRLDIAEKIVARAEDCGISRERILFDCLAESIGINQQAAATTLRTMRMVKEKLGLNLVLGASNISFGLPGRAVINAIFLGLAIGAGLDCAIVNVQTTKPYILAADLLSGRDRYARRHTTYYRSLKARNP